MARHIKDDLSLVIAGQAGQGIYSVAHLLTHILKLQGYHVFATSEYMSRVRGGINSTTIRVSSVRKDAFRSTIDLFVPLDSNGFEHCKKRFTEETIFMGVRNDVFCKGCVMEMDYTAIARAVGSRLYENTVAVGAIVGLLGLHEDAARNFIRKYFIKKGEDVIKKNQEALSKGFKMGMHFAFSRDITVSFQTDMQVEKNLFLSGNDAIGFGALAAGCDFCAAYPMSPSTGVFTFLAQHGKECGVIAEQATDEIEAINMALGASYAGARSIVTTAGGGFSLMCESISLAAMTETPITIFVGQRPGPATGLPTRTAQEDLDLVLYAGHGEFMRVVFAPATVISAFELTAHALHIADHYQIPTFILADQFFVDALYTVPKEEFVAQEHAKNIVETERTYQRYALTDNGVSPRGVPGFGDGLVCVDADEHDEDGRITEDMDQMRVAMMNKRLHQRKKILVACALLPEIIGKKSAKTFVVCWGSNRNVVCEAVENMEDKDVSVVSFTQVYPLHKTVKKIFAKAENIIVIENNATGQFANVLAKECAVYAQHKILKSNGEPFSVEELTEKLRKLSN